MKEEEKKKEYISQKHSKKVNWMINYIFLLMNY